MRHHPAVWALWADLTLHPSNLKLRRLSFRSPVSGWRFRKASGINGPTSRPGDCPVAAERNERFFVQAHCGFLIAGLSHCSLP